MADAVVFDLDGTLVRLAVNWAAARRSVAEALAETDLAATGDLWTLVDRAREAGHGAAVEDALAAHEGPGARDSTRLPLADRIPTDRPVAVCSLNGERAVRTALATHDLADRIDAVVGRDTVAAQKPDPDPLLEAIDRIGADPRSAVFVGDSPTDAETAERAGVAFTWAQEF